MQTISKLLCYIIAVLKRAAIIFRKRGLIYEKQKNFGNRLVRCNGVLGNFSFTNGNGASFSKSGNTLTITKTGSISPSTVFSATRSLPSAENSKKTGSCIRTFVLCLSACCLYRGHFLFAEFIARCHYSSPRYSIAYLVRRLKWFTRF